MARQRPTGTEKYAACFEELKIYEALTEEIHPSCYMPKGERRKSNLRYAGTQILIIRILGC